MNLPALARPDRSAGFLPKGVLATGLIMSMSWAPLPGLAGSLFGDYTCSQWMSMAHPAKKTWADAFLAPLSLTHRSHGKSGEYTYHEDPAGADKAVVFIDAYCARHPERVAADAGAAYFKGLTGR